MKHLKMKLHVEFAGKREVYTGNKMSHELITVEVG